MHTFLSWLDDLNHNKIKKFCKISVINPLWNGIKISTHSEWQWLSYLWIHLTINTMKKRPSKNDNANNEAHMCVIDHPCFQPDTGLINTVQWHYNLVRIFQNTHNRHPIACPWGQDMGCLLWVKTSIKVIPQPLQWCMHYLVILIHIIMALYCMCLNSIEACISNHMPSSVWDEITYPLPKFNGATTEV